MPAQSTDALAISRLGVIGKLTVGEVVGLTKTYWTYLATNVEYTGTVTAIAGGEVLECTYAGTTYYRHITTAESVNGYPIEDAFYLDFTGGNLANKINQRGE